MPIYRISGPDGSVYRVTAPEGASEEEVLAYVQRSVAPAAPAEQISESRAAGRKLGDTNLGTAGASLLTALQGPTFGFADELAGGLGGLGSMVTGRGFAPGYQQARDYTRGAIEQHQRDYPASSAIGQIAASLPLGGPIVKGAGAIMAPASGVIGRTAQAAGIGGALGALGGAGGAENVNAIPEEMLAGGAFGAMTAGVLEPVTMGVFGAGKAVLPRLSGAAARTAAQQRVANAITQDERTAAQVGARMGTLGGEARIADAAGQSTRDLLDLMATLPGTTKNKAEALVRARQVSRPERLDAAVQGLTGGARAQRTLAGLQAQKEQASKPLYDAVRGRVVPITPELESLMQRPAFREAFDQAVTNAANRGEQLPLIEDLLKVGPAAGIKVGFWDEVKRGLDDVIAAKKRGLDRPSPSNKNLAQSTLRSALDIKHELVGEVDKLTGGAYKAARDAYAGPAALQSALEDGLGVWSMKAGEAASMLAGMSASEQQAFRIGAGEKIRELAGSPSGQAQLLNAWKDRNLREKLQAIYGTQTEYRKALVEILKEERLRKIEGAIGRGSQTAKREAGAEELNLGVLTDAAHAASSAARGSIPGMLEAARRVYGRMATPEPVRNEIGRILMSGGAAGRQEVQSLAQIIADIQRRNAGEAAFTGLLGSSLPRL